MVKIHLNTTQKSRLCLISKIKCRQLQRLRDRLPCKVKASHAFTGDSIEFEVACVEDLRACLEENMRFGKARIFYESRELSDFDVIETHVTFIQESVPELAIRYLWEVFARTRTRVRLTTTDEVDIRQLSVRSGRWVFYPIMSIISLMWLRSFAMMIMTTVQCIRSRTWVWLLVKLVWA